MASTDIHKAEFSEPRRKEYLFNLYQRCLGFGKYYYWMKKAFIRRYCCDNKRYKLSEKEHMADKRGIYMYSIKCFRKE